MLSLIFHMAVFSLNFFTLWYDQNYIDIPFSPEIKKHNLPFKNRILFLTLWCLALQTVYFGVCIFNDLFGKTATKNKPVFRYIRDALFSLAFPIALYVSIAFWAIYVIDKDLIFPDVLAKVMPAWVNHVMHTFITPFIFIEMLICHIQYPSRKIGVSMIVLFTASYLTVLNLGYLKTGIWVYPVLEVFNWPVRVFFFAVSMFVGVFLYYFGEKMNTIINASGKKHTKGLKHKN